MHEKRTRRKIQHRTCPLEECRSESSCRLFLQKIDMILKILILAENVFQQRGGESLASIKDVARQAGVAISTVSKVLNGYEGVSESTKDKVNAAIEALNYTPNAVAAALSSKQFGKQLAAWMRSTCSIFPARSTGQRN